MILQFEKYFKQKFPELDAGFYISKRNICVHMSLNKAIFSYSNYKAIIDEYKKNLENYLSHNFIVNNSQLIHTAKWKFDYIVSNKKNG